MTDMPNTKSSQLKWVLFDLGGVLISLRPIREVFPFQQRLTRDPGADDTLERELAGFVRSEIFDRFERGLATKEEFFSKMKSLFPTRLSVLDLEACYRKVLGDEVEGMASLVEDVKRAGIRVAGLTDTSPVHLELLADYPAVRALETVIASCVTGHRKPHPETYRDALRRLEASPDELYYVDDKLENVDGARRAGLRADVFQGATALRSALGLP